MPDVCDRQTVRRAVERRSPGRVPSFMCTWWGEGLREQHGPRLDELARAYPDDVARVELPLPNWAGHPYSWRKSGDDAVRAHDAKGLLPDWRHLDEFIATSPTVEGLSFEKAAAAVRQHRTEGRYVLAGFWNFFFERPWVLRGMENLLLDYYDHPEEVHRLHGYLRDVYVALIRRAAGELAPDGLQTSDDLGNQRSLNMTPDQFREFCKPYYREVIAELHRHGMHLWLHSCGNNTDIMEDLIEVGVDMFHPVQKHTMDWPDIARRFGGRIGFWAGFDVQQTLQTATPAEVRAEVRLMLETFNRPEGGLVLGAGNGITGGTPLANIEAFLDEVHRQL